MPSATVPEAAKQACNPRDPRTWAWVEPSVWTERMLAALVTGSTRRLWAPPELARSRSPNGCFRRRANPDEETTDWRAVCGRTARTVRREGRRKPSLPLSKRCHRALS
jgi:hypothetical protein